MAYFPSEYKYHSIVEGIIEAKGLSHIDPSLITVISEDNAAPKKTIAKMRRIIPPYDLLTSKRFFLILYDKKINSLSEAQIQIIIYHELLHIDLDGVSLVDHDLVDFHRIVTEFGMGWANNHHLGKIVGSAIPELPIEEVSRDVPQPEADI